MTRVRWMMKYSPPKAEVLDSAVSMVVSACRTVFMDSLECVILKGSAVKGDFVQGYSDFDFHVFLKPEAMDGETSPEVEGAIEFQKAIGNFNPKDFGASQFQIYFINSEKYPQDWLPPTEGTCKILWGKMPSNLRKIDDSTYLRYARQFLSSVESDKQKLIERFVDKPNSGVPSVVRLLGATVKGHIYSVSMLLASKPKTVLRMKLDELIPVVEAGIGSKGNISKFFEYISNWSLMQENCEYAREAFRVGIEALEEISGWALKMLS